MNSKRVIDHEGMSRTILGPFSIRGTEYFSDVVRKSRNAVHALFLHTLSTKNTVEQKS